MEVLPWCSRFWYGSRENLLVRVAASDGHGGAREW